jgi:hypothetical protein
MCLLLFPTVFCTFDRFDVDMEWSVFYLEKHGHSMFGQ